jgi:uncharacterized protein (DUF433 family)
MNSVDSRIVSDPQVMLGKPCVRGTRLTVEHILESLAGRRSFDELLEAHHRLTPEDISAALEFAAAEVRRASGF